MSSFCTSRVTLMDLENASFEIYRNVVIFNAISRR